MCMKTRRAVWVLAAALMAGTLSSCTLLRQAPDKEHQDVGVLQHVSSRQAAEARTESQVRGLLKEEFKEFTGPRFPVSVKEGAVTIYEPDENRFGDTSESDTHNCTGEVYLDIAVRSTRILLASRYWRDHDHFGLTIAKEPWPADCTLDQTRSEAAVISRHLDELVNHLREGWREHNGRLGDYYVDQEGAVITDSTGVPQRFGGRGATFRPSPLMRE
ncbi:hypothetical protein [Streptomyces sp. NPDC049590]|uniref:hypothetical protein n=1 Tax=Streptomyces sp. NPDC049590 TaxID=3154834 RepID=UPI0034282A0D